MAELPAVRSSLFLGSGSPTFLSVSCIVLWHSPDSSTMELPASFLYQPLLLGFDVARNLAAMSLGQWSSRRVH
jgi:hypothetical protein